MKDIISRYLKYGDAQLFDYGEVIEPQYYDWDYAKAHFYDEYFMSMFDFQSHEISFCGTLTGCTMVNVLGDALRTWSVDVGVDVEGLSKSMKLDHVYGYIDLENLEKDLFIINELYDTPRASIEDIYAYSRQKELSKRGIKKIYCEGGSDWLLLGYEKIYAAIMALAIKRKEYSILKAAQYGSAKSMMTDRPPSSYIESFFLRNVIFPDDELEELGLVPHRPQLREDKLNHIIRFAFDWGYNNVYKRRTKVFGDRFNLNIYSPFYNNKKFVDFCLSLPMEMKYCLGRGKHILKESVPVSDEVKDKIIPKLSDHIYKYIKNDFNILLKKYLNNKNNILFKYLPFEVVQKHLDNYMHSWQLLNLAIWLEIHDG